MKMTDLYQMFLIENILWLKAEDQSVNILPLSRV